MLAAIAAAAIINIVYAIIKLIAASAKYTACKSKSIKTTGTVTEVKKQETVYKDRAKTKATDIIYTYGLKLAEGAEADVNYAMVSSPNIPAMEVGTVIDVFYDSASATVEDANKLKKNVNKYLIDIGGSAAVLLLLFIIAMAL